MFYANSISKAKKKGDVYIAVFHRPTIYDTVVVLYPCRLQTQSKLLSSQAGSIGGQPD